MSSLDDVQLSNFSIFTYPSDGNGSNVQFYTWPFFLNARDIFGGGEREGGSKFQKYTHFCVVIFSIGY